MGDMAEIWEGSRRPGPGGKRAKLRKLDPEAVGGGGVGRR